MHAWKVEHKIQIIHVEELTVIFVIYKEDPHKYKKVTYLFLFERHLGSYDPVDKHSHSTGMQFSW
jgi:hypothetical protein